MVWLNLKGHISVNVPEMVDKESWTTAGSPSLSAEQYYIEEETHCQKKINRKNIRESACSNK